MKRSAFFGWFWFTVGALYFLLPLIGTLIFSLQKQRGVLSLAAYQSAFADSQFGETFLFSLRMAVLTIIACLLLLVPTAYWVHLRTPHLRPVIEFVTLLPFVIPAIVLVFGLIKTYSRTLTLLGLPVLPPLTNTTFSTDLLLIAGYVVLSMPYFYRAIDTGLRSMDVRTLTEAAQSLGASWVTILWRIILPNLRSALLSGALLTFATVIGELTLATFLARPAFGPYLALLGNHRAYEPAALSIVSFLLTWLAMMLIQWLTRGTRQGTLAGAR
jgi:putative spermidine/putrescine transport system permease protein